MFESDGELTVLKPVHCIEDYARDRLGQSFPVEVHLIEFLESGLERETLIDELASPGSQQSCETEGRTKQAPGPFQKDHALDQHR